MFVFGDQWRAQATGYAGDGNVQTPCLNRFAAESVQFTRAVSCSPVCSPYRASLMTGQYPLTHGMFVNDQPLRRSGPTFAEALNDAGYHTGISGNGISMAHGRQNYIPQERRLGFQWWRGFECCHDYQTSRYYADTEKALLGWLDAEAQTRLACEYLASRTTSSHLPCS